MINKKTLFKNIFLFLCLVPMLVLSLFSLVPSKQCLNVAAADETSTSFTFNGSNVVTTNTNAYNRTAQAWHFISVNFSIIYDGVSYSVKFTGNCLGRGTGSNFGSIEPFNSTISNISQGSQTTSVPLTNAVTYSVPFVTELYGNFNGNVKRVVFNSFDSALTSDFDTSHLIANAIVNTVTYIDDMNNYFRFYIQTSYLNSSLNPVGVISSFAFQEREYFIDINFSDNAIYENGYTNGYTDGLSDGSSFGYTDGYNAGQTIGYENGYSAGLVAGGDHTFMSLIGAVIDAPVSAFTSLLNFELLGVNLLGFITGLLTLAIIVFIIKLCLGGK